MAKERVSISVEEALVPLVDAAAAQHGENRSEFVSRVLTDLMEGRLAPPPPPRERATTDVKGKFAIAGAPQGVHIFPPPEGVDPETYARRVTQLAGGGLPWNTASGLARQEFKGVRDREGRRIAQPTPQAPEPSTGQQPPPSDPTPSSTPST